MTTVFDNSTRLLTDDLAHLHGQLEKLIYLLSTDPKINSMQRALQEIDRIRLTDITDDISRALGENDE